MKEHLQKLIGRNDLPQAQVAEAFETIMSGNATPAQIGAFLVLLRAKGETVEEIAGAASVMRRHAVFVDPQGLPVVDTCGTGGDGSGTFNISTAAAFVVAGAGVPVAKHGNKAMTSKCGSADVLAALGVNIEAPHEVVEECIREIGIGFLYAPRLHPAMRFAGPVRRELGVRTVFNILGPLTNPAGAKCQVLGVFDPTLTEPLAHVLRILGSRRAFVVHGHDGLDEITTTGRTRVSELRDGAVRTYDLDALEFFDDYADPAALAGGDPPRNAEILRGIFAGQLGAPRDIVCLNAAAAIAAAGKAVDLKSGLRAAQEAIDSGAAREKLEKLIEATA